MKENSMNNVEATVKSLLSLEKAYWQAGDDKKVGHCCCEILDIYFAAKLWGPLNDKIRTLSLRKGQYRTVVVDIFLKALSYLEHMYEIPTISKLIETLRVVSVGQLAVDIDRARITSRLAQIYEMQGKYTDSIALLQDLSTETHFSLNKSEKIFCKLEQIRLLADNRDFTRALLTSNTIGLHDFSSLDTPYIEEGYKDTGKAERAKLNELKLKFFYVKIRIHEYEQNYQAMYLCYKEIYRSEPVNQIKSIWVPILQKICWLLILGLKVSGTSGFLYDFMAEKRLKNLQPHYELLQLLKSKRVLLWDEFVVKFECELRQEQQLFAGLSRSRLRKDLWLNIVLHNINVISQSYSCMYFAHLSSLLNFPNQLEEHLSELIVDKSAHAKINRPAGIVSFMYDESIASSLRKWFKNIGTLITSVEKICASIHNEAVKFKIADIMHMHLDKSQT